MSLTKLTVSVDNVQALTDRPNSNEGLTSEQLKLAFDKAGEDIKAYNNNTLTVELDALIASVVAGTGLANGSVTNSKVATGIDMVKIADGSVTNTEVQYINTLSSNAQTQLDAKIPITQKGAASGVVPLNSSSKIDTAYIPDSVLGQLEYQGTYNATTNVPTLPAAASSKGFYYVISTGGTVSSIVYAVGDWIVSNGTAWEKVDNTDAVATVFGRTGAIVPATNDYNFAQIDKTTSSLLDLTTRSASDLNTGTLPVGRIPTAIPATSIGNGDVTNAILSFLNTLSSNAQTQLNAKAPLTHVGLGGVLQHPVATALLEGFMSIADKTKLDGLSPTGLAGYTVPADTYLTFGGRYKVGYTTSTDTLDIYET